ncbi:MAG: DUF962 domain-containing protein [Nevskia sp.]
MKSIHGWLDDYSVSHRDPQNKLLHRICVPLIVWSALGALRAIPLGDEILNACTVAIVLMLAYYLLLSWRLTLGMALLLAATWALIEASYRTLGSLHLPLMAAVFVLAWVGQFLGHRIEGVKPSFFKDLQFLLIGPLWLLADVYQRLRLSVSGSPTAVRS